MQLELEGLVGQPQVTLQAFDWSTLSRTFWNSLSKSGRTADILLSDVSSVDTLWLGLRELFRHVQTSAAVKLLFQSEEDWPNDKELNPPPAEGQVAPGAVGFGSGEISRECYLEGVL